MADRPFYAPNVEAEPQKSRPPAEVAECWRQMKGKRIARGVLVKHPAGCELRITVGGELVFSRAFSLVNLVRLC